MPDAAPNEAKKRRATKDRYNTRATSSKNRDVRRRPLSGHALLCGRTGYEASVRVDPIQIWPATNCVCMIPAGGTENLELGIQEPLFGRSTIQRHERFFTNQAPCIWTGGIGVISPEKSDAVRSVNGMGDVVTNEADALHSVFGAIDLTSHGSSHNGILSDSPVVYAGKKRQSLPDKLR